MNDDTTPHKGASELHRLRALAKRLNDSSDSIRARVAEFDKALKALNLGIEAWGELEINGYQLGYAKVIEGTHPSQSGRSWGVAYRSVAPSAYQTRIGSDGPGLARLLANAPRQTLLLLVGSLETVPLILERAASEMVNQIEQAEKVGGSQHA